MCQYVVFLDVYCNLVYVHERDARASRGKIDFDYEILNEKYRVAIRENKEELGFLKFLKDNININGIELYEIKDDGSTNKFFLDSDNKITSAPCQ